MSDPVRLTDDFPSSPVRITNLQELVDFLNNSTGISTVGTHLEEPPRWDDLRFPAQAINPAGAIAAPTVDTTLTAFPGTLIFSGSQINIITGIAQLPHAWKEGTDLHPHIHWQKVAADAEELAVQWQFKTRVSNVGGVWSEWTSWGNVISEIGDPHASGNHVMSSFPVIDMEGRTVSCLVAWQIQRVGTDDAYNGTARLFEFDIHYQVDSLGSTEEYEK